MIMKIALSLYENSGVDICSVWLRTMLRYRVRTQVSRKFWSIVWTIVWVCLVCLLHLWNVNWCYRTELAQRWTLLLQRSNWTKWIGLVTWVVVSHMMIVYRKKCNRTCRRRDWYLLVCCICDFGVTSDYRSVVEYTGQQWGRNCSMSAKHGCWE